MKERRKHERFSLALPAKIELMDPEKQAKTYDLLTTDVCASGAFFLTKEPIRKDTRVKVELTMSNAQLRKMAGSDCLVRVGGTVVRSDSEGMAICFDEVYEHSRTS